MALGPGKYDDICSLARDRADAAGAILIVIGGRHGNGFSCQADAMTLARLPDILELVARQIRDDMKKGAVR